MNYSNSQRAGVILYLTALIFGAYNIEKIQRRIARTISTEEALKDVIPFQSEDVLAERSKIILTVDPGLKKREDRL